MSKLLVLILAITTLAGCANRLQLPEYKSGFLKDYHLFRPNPRADNSWVRTKRGFKLEELPSYEKIALAPIEVWLNPEEKMEITDKDKQKALTDYFEQQIKANVGDKFEFVAPGTPDSLLVRMALTDIRETEPGLKLRDALPIAMARNAVQASYRLVAGKKAVIGAASLEVEFVDTNSQKGLVAVIVSNDSGEVNVDDMEDNIDSVKMVVDDWVKRLVKALTTPEQLKG